MDKTTRVIRLDEPLPCGITGGGDVPCGRPALAAYADPDPLRPGQWVLTPICERHAAAMAAMYAQGGAAGPEPEYMVTKDGFPVFVTRGDPHQAIMTHARSVAQAGYPITDLSVYQDNPFGNYQAIAISTGAVGKRYVAQLRAPDGDRWEDCAYFDAPDRAARFVRTAAETNPNVGAGRVFDQATGQVVEDPDR